MKRIFSSLEADLVEPCQYGGPRVGGGCGALAAAGYQTGGVLLPKHLSESLLSPQGYPVVHIPDVGQRLVSRRMTYLVVRPDLV